MLPHLLFSLTLLISAALVFWIQLLTSKMILPVLGGSAAVWNTCMMFFQIALLLGYLYAHVACRWRFRHLSMFIHPVFLAIAALTLHLSMTNISLPSPTINPIWWLLGTLLVMMGAPFIILAGTAPMLQTWFTETGARSSHDPYFLYAASNLGSLGALLSYPAFIEPYLNVADQSRLWTAGYVTLVVLTAACALLVAMRQGKKQTNELVNNRGLGDPGGAVSGVGTAGLSAGTSGDEPRPRRVEPSPRVSSSCRSDGPSPQYRTRCLTR